ncbi:MAG: NADH-quinone oxidoreductase subunit A [Candidatus Marinimicrobia bacterium]|nr:NADH-quinone oxidoreductase subunit A [Candidatus Neomarinimicrobiota bacterium]
MYFDFLTIFTFLLAGGVLVAILLYVAKLFRPHRPQAQKYLTYECGEEIEGPSWVQFNIRFYVIALIFIIFDVEIIFLFPWAVVFKQLGLFAFIEMLIFISILLVGLAYAWRRGDLDWVRLNLPYGTGRYARQSVALMEDEREKIEQTL